MKNFGLIGDPITHSLSPVLFNAGYSGKYTYDLIEGADFNKSFQIFLDKYDGINVTAPFKENAFLKADIFSEECQTIGAANILIKTPEGIKAYNSDYLGVRKWLKEISNGQKMKVLIAGCGGAGKAAFHAAISLGMPTTIMNRDKTKVDDFIARYSHSQNNALIKSTEIENFNKELYINDILIYNIPLSIPAISQINKKDFINRTGKLHILEANYRNPSFDKRLQECIKNSNGKAEYTNGKTWLLYQALTGYEIFTGETPDLEKMSACL